MEFAKTYERVKIAVTSASTATLKAAGTNLYNRLHGLVLTGASTAYSVATIESAAVALSGDMNLPKDGTLVIPFEPRVEGVLATSKGAALLLKVAGAGKAAGYAIVSQSTI